MVIPAEIVCVCGSNEPKLKKCKKSLLRFRILEIECFIRKGAAIFSAGEIDEGDSLPFISLTAPWGRTQDARR